MMRSLGWAWMLLGVLAGSMVWALGTARGFDDTLSQGIQATETGQVEMVSTSMTREQYLKLASELRATDGVLAVSGRSEFSILATNSVGRSRKVVARVVNFFDEDQVTGLGRRVLNGVSGSSGGLLIPSAWVSEAFAYPSSQILVTPTTSRAPSRLIPVIGSLADATDLEGHPFVTMDWTVADAFEQSVLRISSIVVALQPGVSPARWRDEHTGLLNGYGGGQVMLWDQLSSLFRAAAITSAAPLFQFCYLWTLAAAVALLVLGWWRRLLGQPLSEVAANLWLFAGALVSVAFALWLVSPVWGNVFAWWPNVVFPIRLHPQLPWAMDWLVIALPLSATCLAVVVSLLRARSAAS